jgi:hypothetical protein
MLMSAENGYHFCNAYRVWVCVYPEVVTPASGLSWLKACFLEYCKLNIAVLHVCMQSPYIRLFSKHDNNNFKFESEIRGYEDILSKNNLLQYVFFNWKVAKIRIMRYVGGVSVSDPNHF